MAKPLLELMQQVLDMQLQWFGNLGLGFPAVAEEPKGPRIGGACRNHWLKAQDNWLAMTQGWLDASKPK